MKTIPVNRDLKGEVPENGTSIIYWPTPHLTPVFAAIRTVQKTVEGEPTRLHLKMDPNTRVDWQSHRRSINATQYLIVADLPKFDSTGELIGEDRFGTKLYEGDPVIAAYSFRFRDHSSSMGKGGVAIGTVQRATNDHREAYIVDFHTVRTVAKDDLGRLVIKEYQETECNKSTNPYSAGDKPVVYSDWEYFNSLSAATVSRSKIFAYKASGVFFKKRLLF